MARRRRRPNSSPDASCGHLLCLFNRLRWITSGKPWQLRVAFGSIPAADRHRLAVAWRRKRRAIAPRGSGLAAGWRRLGRHLGRHLATPCLARSRRRGTPSATLVEGCSVSTISKTAERSWHGRPSGATRTQTLGHTYHFARYSGSRQARFSTGPVFDIGPGEIYIRAPIRSGVKPPHARRLRPRPRRLTCAPEARRPGLSARRFPPATP